VLRRRGTHDLEAAPSTEGAAFRVRGTEHHCNAESNLRPGDHYCAFAKVPFFNFGRNAGIPLFLKML
jgi:hypothetical protein